MEKNRADVVEMVGRLIQDLRKPDQRRSQKENRKLTLIEGVLKGNISPTYITSANGAGRYDAELGTVHHFIIVKGCVDNGNILLLLLLAIWHKESRRGLRFMNRLGVEIRGNLGKRVGIPGWGMDGHITKIGR
jgi:hypothetical protein